MLFRSTSELNPKVRGLTTPRLLRPIQDGWLIPKDERAALLAGHFNAMPMIVGSNTDEGTLLTTLSNNRNVYAYFNVSEQEYLDYKTRLKQVGGNAVSLLLANNQPHRYKGTIETIEGEFDNNTGNIAFRAKFPNPDLLLKHGETGKVQMTLPLHQVLVIPQKATYELQDKTYVYEIGRAHV